MKIHVVQPGETIESIAQMYGVSAVRLTLDNGLNPSDELVVGQSIVIAYPLETYTVQQGDTLNGIAAAHNITMIQLLRNNPFLSGREYIYPGEVLVIRYDNNKGSITTTGFAYPFISRDILRRTLPFLTYLAIFGYRFTDEADIIEIEDDEVITVAKEYGVAPLMMLSTLSQVGIGSAETAFRIIYNKDLGDKLIENTIRILKRKGYYGLNISPLYMNADNIQAYEAFINRFSARLKREGLYFTITIAPLIIIENNFLTYEKIDYSRIAQAADEIIVTNYYWGYNYGPPGPVASIASIREFLNYIITFIPRQKIIIGLPLLGYIWSLPYIIGISRASSLTLDSALTLAREAGTVIQFDEVSQTPFYRFIDYRGEVPLHYVVWFVDSRTVAALMDVVSDLELPGTGFWNIMYYSPQLWLVINTQYKITTISEDNKMIPLCLNH